MARFAQLALLLTPMLFTDGRRVGGFVVVPPKAVGSIQQPRSCISTRKASPALTKPCKALRSDDISHGRSQHSTLNKDGHDGGGGASDASRRALLSLPLALGLGSGSLSMPLPAHANLMQFPCEEGTLMNTYHFMRAGESLLEADDIMGTNPLFITNRDAALSERGLKQVQEACNDMMAKGLNPSVVNYSLAAKCIDTANLVANEMMVGRNRIVPEYVLLDPRGVGKWDMTSLSLNEAAVWALDDMEAGLEGLKGRPPPNDDGTPNETLSNQVTRLRQLMSVLETLYSGDSILLIFPDGTGPALLSALIAGIPVNRVHELNFSAGEVRYDVTMKNTLALLPSQPSQDYKEVIQRGKERLQFLREHPEEVVSIKEQRLREDMMATEAKRMEIERAREEARLEKEAALAAAQEQKRQAERERTNKLEATRQLEGGDASANGQPNWPGFVSVASLGLAAAMAAVRANDVPKFADDVNSYTEPPPTDGDLPVWQRVAPVDDPSLEVESATSSELQAMEERIQKAPVDVPEFNSIDELRQSRLNVPGRVRVTADDKELITENDLRGGWDHNLLDGRSSEEYRTELAKNAMEEYMNRDDGGDAWIDMLSDMMDDES